MANTADEKVKSVKVVCCKVLERRTRGKVNSWREQQADVISGQREEQKTIDKERERERER